MIAFRKSNTYFSLFLTHFRYSEVGVFLFQFVWIQKNLLMSHEIGTVKEFIREKRCQNALEPFSIFRMHTVPHFRSTLMKKIDGRQIKILNVPVEESSPSPNKQKGSIKSMYLFCDNVGEKRRKMRKLPLSRTRIHERFFNIGPVQFIVQCVINAPELSQCQCTQFYT